MKRRVKYTSTCSHSLLNESFFSILPFGLEIGCSSPMIDLITLGLSLCLVVSVIFLVFYVTAAKDCGSYNPFTIVETFRTSYQEIKLYNAAFSKREALMYHLGKAKNEGNHEAHYALSEELDKLDEDIDEMERVMRFKNKKKD